MQLPILYSFRRCPYAIRARMALQIAEINYELRNILLKDKPTDMLEKSAKGTVPVLVLDDKVLDESLDVMLWALKQNDKLNLLDDLEQSLKLINKNDTEFKFFLDRYKYPDRYEEEGLDYQVEASKFVYELESLLKDHRFLIADEQSLADFAIFPFIRQFRMPNEDYFNNNFPQTKKWLEFMMDTEYFKQEITKKPLYNNPKFKA
jgi:glutathione S-transferase